MLENKFQSDLIKEIEEMLPGCHVLNNNANQTQGFPDLTILYKKKWAVLECKREKDAEKQPNQEYYIEDCNKQSFARFIYPENKKEVLDELQRALGTRRSTRVPKRK